MLGSAAIRTPRKLSAVAPSGSLVLGFRVSDTVRVITVVILVGRKNIDSSNLDNSTDVTHHLSCGFKAFC